MPEVTENLCRRLRRGNCAKKDAGDVAASPAGEGSWELGRGVRPSYGGDGLR
jgi:hypothetical protein